MLLQVTELKENHAEKSRERKNIYQAHANLNNDGEAILITDKIEFKASSILGVMWDNYELYVLK